MPLGSPFCGTPLHHPYMEPLLLYCRTNVFSNLLQLSVSRYIHLTSANSLPHTLMSKWKLFFSQIIHNFTLFFIHFLHSNFVLINLITSSAISALLSCFWDSRIHLTFHPPPVIFTMTGIRFQFQPHFPCSPDCCCTSILFTCQPPIFPFPFP